MTTMPAEADRILDGMFVPLESEDEVSSITAGGPGSGRYPKGSGKAGATKSVQPSGGAGMAGADGVLDPDEAEEYWTARYGKGALIDDGGTGGEAAKADAAAVIGEGMSDVSVAEIGAAVDSMGGQQIGAFYNKSKEDGKYVTLDKYGQLTTGRAPGLKRPDAPAVGVLAGTPEGDAIFREAAASKLVGNWAKTSNDSSSVSLGIQKAAEIEFGLDGVTYDGVEPDVIAKGVQFYNDNSKVLRSFHKSQYNATQAQFKADGIKEVTGYRGVMFYDSPIKGGKNQKVRMRPLSSFSVSSSVADDFGGGSFVAADGRMLKGYIISGKVKVKDIVGMPGTGQGCLHEAEIVVKGGTKTFDIEDTSNRKYYDSETGEELE